MVEVSIVIPMRNEAGNAAPLIEATAEACAALSGFEIVAVDDGSTDATSAEVKALAGHISNLRLLQHSTGAGQSAAIHSGVQAARAALVATLDGDGQNPPADLPRLLATLAADRTGRLGLVAGQRTVRHDARSKRLASHIANALRSRILHDGTRDTGCGLKVFRRDAFLALPYFDHMHRYLPALFKRDGWEVALADVSHAERHAGRSNYANLDRARSGIVDLLGMAWLVRRRKKAVAVEAALPAADRAHG